MEKKEVIKHSSAIQISNEVNLLQRKAFNVLLANAFNDLDRQELFRISIRDLCAVLGYDSNNDSHLKQLLRDLVKINVEWNLFGKDGQNEWGVASLLAEAKIINGVIIYGYAPSLRKRLHNPLMYAKISLSLQNKFKSKHSLALYELFVDYFNVKNSHGETPFISIENFRKLLGLKDNEYKRYKDLNLYIIKKALKEINAKSDLFVDVEYKKEGRKVAAIKFFIKKNFDIDIEAFETAIKSDQKKLPIPDFEIINQKLLQTLLTEFGISNNKACEIIKAKDEFYIQEVLDVVRKQIVSGKIKDIPAFTIKALQDDYRRKKVKYEVDKEKKEAEKKKKQKEKRLLEKLEEDFNQQQKQKIKELFEGLSDKQKTIWQKRFEKEELLNSNKFVQKKYKQKGIEDKIVQASFRYFIATCILPEEVTHFEAYAEAKGYEVSKQKEGGYTIKKIS